MDKTIDIPSETQALAVIDDKPSSLMRKATDVAGICREIVLKTACQIQGRKYVKCEGWMAIATAHGCVAGSRDVEKIEGGWRAIGEIRRIADGVLLAQAEGFVGLDETKTWAIRPEYACRAMAQTRAISRACRAAFAHVVVLMDANLSTTPAEEVPEGGFDDAKTPPAPSQASRPAPAPKAPASTPRRAAKPTVASREERIKGLESWLGDKKEWAVAFLRMFTVDGSDANSALMPNEGLDGLNDSALDLIKANPKGFLACLDIFIAENGTASDLAPVVGGQTQGVAPAGSAPQPPQPAANSEWFWDVIVTVPHKGQTRADYIKSPDTIRSLYDAMKTGDEDAQKRLWGFVGHYDPKPWKGNDGKERPPSEADLNFRRALDAFADYEEAHGDVTQ